MCESDNHNFQILAGPFYYLTDKRDPATFRKVPGLKEYVPLFCTKCGIVITVMSYDGTIKEKEGE